MLKEGQHKLGYFRRRHHWPHARDILSEAFLHSAYQSSFYDIRKPSVVSQLSLGDWKTGETVNRFTWLVRLDSLQDFHHLEALCSVSFNDYSFDLPSVVAWQSLTPEAKMSASHLAVDDEPEETTRRRESKYFQTVGPARLALARKITFASNRNDRFVADYRLWKWVGEFYRALLAPYV